MNPLNKRAQLNLSVDTALDYAIFETNRSMCLAIGNKTPIFFVSEIEVRAYRMKARDEIFPLMSAAFLNNPKDHK